MEAKAAIAFIVAQILFKLIFEFESSRTFAETHPMPAFKIIVIFTIVWAVICLLCLVNLRTGYLLAVIFGVLNLFPLVLLIMGIAPHPYRPYFNGWITLSLIYFSYHAYLSHGERGGEKDNNREQETMNAQNNSPPLTLTEMAAGEVARVETIEGENTLISRMAAIGFTPGVAVTMVRNSGGRKPLIVTVRDSRIALGRDVANKIIVRKKEQ